jgi:hypothetical protein
MFAKPEWPEITAPIENREHITLHQDPCLVVHERRSRTDIVLVAEFDDV